MPTTFTLKEIQEICTNENVPLGLRYQLAYLGIGHHLDARTVIGTLAESPFTDVESEAAADLKAKTNLYAYSICSGFHNDYKREPTRFEKLAANAYAIGFANKIGLFASTYSDLETEVKAELEAKDPDTTDVEVKPAYVRAKAQEAYIDLARRAAVTIISRTPSLATEEIDIDAVSVKESVKSNFDYNSIRSIRELLDKAKADAESRAKDAEEEKEEISREEAARREAAEIAAKLGQVVVSSVGKTTTGHDAEEDQRERVVADADAEAEVEVDVSNDKAKPKPNLS